VLRYGYNPEAFANDLALEHRSRSVAG
jgi:hypothetical protein